MKFFECVRQAFGVLTPEQVVEAELLEARLSLLRAQTVLEYSEAIVQYETKRIARLSAVAGTGVAA